VWLFRQRVQMTIAFDLAFLLGAMAQGRAS
jgi:hypothetical protein